MAGVGCGMTKLARRMKLSLMPVQPSMCRLKEDGADPADAVLVQQALDASQADTELLGHVPSCDARPIKIDHGLKILGRETITQLPRADHTLWGGFRAPVVVLTAV